MSPRALLVSTVVATIVAALACEAAAQTPPKAPKPLKPGEECSVPDDPATVARRELTKRTETYFGLSSMTVDHALHVADDYWRDREQALLRDVAAALPPLPKAAPVGTAPPDSDRLLELYYVERLQGIADSCRILGGSDPRACTEYWEGMPADVCRAWLAVRDLALGDVASCDRVAEEHRAFCLFKAKGPKTTCQEPTPLVADGCMTLEQARKRDWSAGCQAMAPNECIGLLSALSLFEGESACDRLPKVAPVGLALRGAPPDPTRDTCLAVVRGRPQDCPIAPFPNMQGPPELAAAVLGGRQGAHLAIAAVSHGPFLCQVVAVVRQGDTVMSVETEMLLSDSATRVRVRRALRPEIDPFEAQVGIQSVCVPRLAWGVVQEPDAPEAEVLAP